MRVDCLWCFLILVDYCVTTPHSNLWESLCRKGLRDSEGYIWPFTHPTLTPHSPHRNQQGTQRKLTDWLLLAHRQSASCSSLFRREQLQRHTLTVVRELWFRKERTASPSGTDWQFALLRLPVNCSLTNLVDNLYFIVRGEVKVSEGLRIPLTHP
jgi:hypothetical protein